MYAVLVTGGKQYRVMQGETIRVEKLDAEVGKSGGAERRDEHIGRLDVAMQHAAAVSGLERRRDAHSRVEHRLHRHRAALVLIAHVVGAELHDEVRPAVGGAGAQLRDR